LPHNGICTGNNFDRARLKQLLAPGEVDSDAALAQVDKVLALENSFKQAHFRLLISIKNALSEEQIATIEERLKAFRDKAKANAKGSAKAN